MVTGIDVIGGRSMRAYGDLSWMRGGGVDNSGIGYTDIFQTAPSQTARSRQHLFCLLNPPMLTVRMISRPLSGVSESVKRGGTTYRTSTRILVWDNLCSWAFIKEIQW